MPEQPNRTWIVIIVAIIGAAGVIIAAISSPFAARIAERLLPVFTPTAIVAPQFESPTQANIPSAPSVASTPVPVFSGQRWDLTDAQVPASGTQLNFDLSAGQMLFLSGGQLKLNNEYCGGDANQICILIFQATTPQTFTIESLVSQNNWYGISSTLTPDEAIDEKKAQFWQPPNCINGCSIATVLYFTDGQLTNKVTLKP
jgi:hypothetical protein